MSVRAAPFTAATGLCWPGRSDLRLRRGRTYAIATGGRCRVDYADRVDALDRLGAVEGECGIVTTE